MGAYALERCSREGRWAAESRALARRLEALPHLREALETGSVGWSMAELLGRHATPQTEAALLQVARGKTVQAMRLALSPQQSAEQPNDEELSRTLSVTVPVEEAWALHATRTMIEQMDGNSTGNHWLESLLAEGYISLLELVAPSDMALRGWQVLGFASEAHYARDRLGFEAARLVARIATADTEGRGSTAPSVAPSSTCARRCKQWKPLPALLAKPTAHRRVTSTCSGCRRSSGRFSAASS